MGRSGTRICCRGLVWYLISACFHDYALLDLGMGREPRQISEEAHRWRDRFYCGISCQLFQSVQGTCWWECQASWKDWVWEGVAQEVCSPGWVRFLDWRHSRGPTGADIPKSSPINLCFCFCFLFDALIIFYWTVLDHWLGHCSITLVVYVYFSSPIILGRAML